MKTYTFMFEAKIVAIVVSLSREAAIRWLDRTAAHVDLTQLECEEGQADSRGDASVDRIEFMDARLMPRA
jgi:hypothetical protein